MHRHPASDNTCAAQTLFLAIGLLVTLAMALVWVWFQDFGQKINQGATWVVMVYATCAGFLIWLRGLRYARLIHDIPTCQIATASQVVNYTERPYSLKTKAKA